MALSPECLGAIHLCRVRATRLDDLGNPVAGPNNVYVSDKPISLGWTPQIATGDEKTVLGGCDCIVSEYKGKDKLKRLDLQLDLALIEPGLLEMLVGGPVVLDIDGNPIGMELPDQIGCASDSQPNICFEGWQDAWDDDHQSPDWPYIHWIFPSSRWQLAAGTLQNDFLQPQLTAFTRKNPNWTDIFGDMAQALVAGMPTFWYTTTVPPTAQCGYQSHSIS